MLSLLKQVIQHLKVDEVAHLSILQKKMVLFIILFLDWLSHVPTTDQQTNQETAVRPAFGIFERRQGASSPAIPQDALDSDDCIDLPTYVSLIAEQSKTSTSVRVLQSLGPAENSASPSLAESIKEQEEEQQTMEGSIDSGPKYVTVEACEVASEEIELLSRHSTHKSQAEENDSGIEPFAHQEKGNCIRPCEGRLDGNMRESEDDREESDVAMPLNHTVVDESDDIPQISLPTANTQPPMPPFLGDPRKELAHRGCLATSKIMKRSSSVISDSGIESEPSSVAWPLDTALRGRPPRDFSSDREIPQQMVCGLQMESNGSLPSAGIQASLTSISSLPYEEDQQQRQLSKLTKSVSAPQISSPEDAEEDHSQLNQETETDSSVQHEDPCKTHCSLLDSKLDSEQTESSLTGPNSTASHAHLLKENVIPENSTHPHLLPEINTPRSVLSGTSEVSHLQDSLERPSVKAGALSSSGSHGQNVILETHISGESASVEDVHLVETETVPCSCGSELCAHKNVADGGGIHAGGERQSFHNTKLLADHKDVDVSQAPLDLLSPQHQSEQANSAAQRPSDLTGLIVNDMTSPVDLNGIADSEKEPLACQAKPSKIPNSGLAFVNKKMVEVVNMSVSCAPTCLPFSSVLRDSPSVSGMSPRQATSPITHQPLGSFGIISSSSLNALTMDEETNERMLK